MNQKKAPTLKDVAERAGVSKMAVSTVLNDRKSTVGVSDATRKRILEALDELQYTPHAMARSLRRQRTDTVGFYNAFGHLDAREPFIREVFQGVHVGLIDSDRDLLLYNGLHLQPESVVLDRLLSNKVDGLILLGPSSQSLVDALVAMDRPALVVGSPYPGLPCVNAADAMGSEMAARHLVELGHRRILYRRDSDTSPCADRRCAAFLKVATGLGATVTISTAADGMESITEFEEQLLLSHGSEGGISAVACWRDYSAVRLINFCRLNQVRVPEDLAIVGFDGLSYPKLPEITLSTVDADWYGIARKAAELLIARIDGETLPDETIVDCKFRVGNTT